jgi:2-hydroxy-6-oxonona-2,4-dienedioate hydrolase
MIQKTELQIAGRRVGGRAGLSPIASGSHVFDRVIPLLAAEGPVLAPDLPGCSGTALGAPQDLDVERLAAFVLGLLDAQSIRAAHLVGHDLGGLVGLWLAITAPDRVRSLAIAASPMCPPTGDGLNDILFDATPLPLWSRRSQAWAFERLSYAHEHIDAALLDACEAAAQGQPHRDAVSAMQDAALRQRNFGIAPIKSRIWEALRTGLSVPTQIVWSSHDPATGREAGYVMFKVMAERQRAAQFHLINRAGSFAFREQPEAFARVVAAFAHGVAGELAA